MNYKKLTSGQKVYFEGEGIPMELIARNSRYGVVVRPLDIEEDYELIYFQVERGIYIDTQEAYEALKSEPVYSLLDFKEERKAPSNMIFNSYDFCSKESCIDCIIDLKKGNHELSKRYEVDLNIDWHRTFN